MELNAAEFDAPGDWREAARNFATATRNGVISTGVLASYVRFDSAADLGALAPAETLLESLLDAGFDEVAAGRFLAFLAEFVYTSARNVIAKTARGEHPQRPELVRALSDAGEEEFSAMKRLMESGLDQFDDAQFEFGLQVAIRGMEPAARSSPSGGGGHCARHGVL